MAAQSKNTGMPNPDVPCRGFVDTCTMMHGNLETLWGVTVPELRSKGYKIIFCASCLNELQKHYLQGKTQKTRESALAAWNSIIAHQKSGDCEIFGDPNDATHADSVILGIFTKFRTRYNLLLITQDSDLARDIRALNNSKSTLSTNQCQAMRLLDDGKLSTRYTKFSKSTLLKITNPVPPSKSFVICSQVRSTPDSKNCVSGTIKERTTLYTQSNQKIVLTEKLDEGGEGIVYKTNTPHIAKVYFPEKNTIHKLEKIKLLISKPLNCPGICAPTEILYNSKHQFVGYLMPKACGTKLSTISIKPKFKNMFPQWSKRDMVELTVTILQKIKYLHDRNVILGDINTNNIMFTSSTDVYFVDVDSYQIEDFPCPVGTIPYTPPELLNKGHYRDFLRTKGNEYFAVAALLFTLMVQGQQPYTQKDSNDMKANILNMDFPYALGNRKNSKTPNGYWRYMWSHLPVFLKKAFYNTFSRGGDYSTEQTRLNADQWLAMFNEFLRLLDSGEYGAQDSMSENIYPTRFKKRKGGIYVFCSCCHNETDQQYCENGVCLDCRRKQRLARQATRACSSKSCKSRPVQRKVTPKRVTLPKATPSPKSNIPIPSTSGISITMPFLGKSQSSLILRILGPFIKRH